jgi:hypothetical protein
MDMDALALTVVFPGKNKTPIPKRCIGYRDFQHSQVLQLLVQLCSIRLVELPTGIWATTEYIQFNDKIFIIELKFSLIKLNNSN